MKTKITKAIYVTAMMLFFAGSMFAQTGNVGINNDGSSPNSKAMLDVSSTTKGFLPPRMTYAEKILITSPPAGLMVWCSNCGPSGELQVYNGTVWTNMVGGSASVPFTIGQSYGGGIIFYIDGTGQHGLISATSDQSTAAEWGCYTTLISGADGTAIGTGNQNTIDIMAGCGSAGIAAKLCWDLVLNGYSDWFLPSQDELNQMYLQKTSIGGFASWFYWSSSQNGPYYAWNRYFSNGIQGSDTKDYPLYVRAVRAF